MTWLHANEPRGQYAPTWYATGTTYLDPLPQLRGSQEADLCVVGAGLSGLSAALHAAQSGLSVIVVDAQRVGWGASGRNGGQVGSGFNWDQSDLEDKFGSATARALWDETEDAKTLTRALIHAHAPQANYRPGIVSTALTPAEFDQKRRNAAEMNNRYGTTLEILEKGALTDRIGSDAYEGGILDLSAGWINPLAYVLGLARACIANGVQVFENSEVHRISPGLVQTGQGRIIARHIFHATNGYAPHLTKKTANRVLPINNYIAVTAPLGHRAPMKNPVAVADSRFVVNYFWQTADGRLVYGGGESYGKRFPQDIPAKVRANLARVYPDLADVDLTHAWGGTLAVTATRLPYLSETADKIYSAGGYSGHGLALSALFGKAVAEAATGDRTRLDLLSKLPVPALPGGRKLGGLITNAAMAFMALRDRLTH